MRSYSQGVTLGVLAALVVLIGGFAVFEGMNPQTFLGPAGLAYVGYGAVAYLLGYVTEN